MIEASMARRFWLVFLFAVLTGCSAVPTATFDDGGQAGGQSRRLVVWMLSDIQPPTPAERVQFERAITDVNDHVGQVDFAVIAGDLLKSRSQDEDFSWFLAARDRSKVTDWYEIAGNHDVRSEPRFRQYFPRPSSYAVEVGNVLLLLMSDESKASQTRLSDETFRWWREMVATHQDRILVTVTHAQLAGSGLLGSGIDSRIIGGSERFEKVLQEQRVAIWASGHCHLPQGLAGTASIREKLGGTFFVNVSSIDEGLLLDSQSRFFIFEDGSDRVWIRSRNHSQGRFDGSLDVELRLDAPFIWKGEGPRVLAR
jgi:predicted phosphodiesterase